MITKQDLIDRHVNRLMYVSSGTSNYGSKPKPLFNTDGSFNVENWNGGDAVIRQYTYHLDWEVEGKQETKEFDVYYSDGKSGISGELIATYSGFQDYNYIQIVIKSCKWDESDSYEREYNQYLIAFYKNRGSTELILMNGKPITFDEYVELINGIEATGFKFELTI